MKTGRKINQSKRVRDGNKRPRCAAGLAVATQSHSSCSMNQQEGSSGWRLGRAAQPLKATAKSMEIDSAYVKRSNQSSAQGLAAASTNCGRLEEIQTTRGTRAEGPAAGDNNNCSIGCRLNIETKSKPPATRKRSDSDLRVSG